MGRRQGVGWKEVGSGLGVGSGWLERRREWEEVGSGLERGREWVGSRERGQGRVGQGRATQGRAGQGRAQGGAGALFKLWVWCVW